MLQLLRINRGLMLPWQTCQVCDPCALQIPAAHQAIPVCIVLPTQVYIKCYVKACVGLAWAGAECTRKRECCTQLQCTL